MQSSNRPQITRAILTVLSATVLVTCGGGNTSSNVTPPGKEKSAGSRVLEGGAALLQAKPPLDALNVYLDGFHFYSGNVRAQMEAHHYCAPINEDVTQCVIYDGNVKDARLMGVEYIVSAAVFQTLSEDEKKLWHSHVHEVKSGQLIAPGIPEAAEHALLKKIVSTYGKTWHTWHTDRRDALPVGIPQLMMGFTADGQIDPQLVAGRDKRFGISSDEKRKSRTDIAAPPIQPGADAWQTGEALQVQIARHRQAGPGH